MIMKRKDRRNDEGNDAENVRDGRVDLSMLRPTEIPIVPADVAYGTETTKTQTTVTVQKMGDVTDSRVEEIAKRLAETDTTVEVLGQSLETAMSDLGRRANETDDRLDNMNTRLIDVEQGVRDNDVLGTKVSALDARIETETKRLDARCNGLYDRVVGVEEGVDKISDMTEEVEVLRDKVRSQEAVIAELERSIGLVCDHIDGILELRDAQNAQGTHITELEGKVAQLETDVCDALEQAGKMIRDVKDESSERIEAMETRIRAETKEEMDARAREAVRVPNKDITQLKQTMEGVFARMKRPVEDPAIRELREQVELMGRQRRSTLAAMAVCAVCGVLGMAFGVLSLIGGI